MTCTTCMHTKQIFIFKKGVEHFIEVKKGQSQKPFFGLYLLLQYIYVKVKFSSSKSWQRRIVDYLLV